MKKLVLAIAVLSVSLTACEENKEGDNEVSGKKPKIEKIEVSDTTESESTVAPLEGVNTVCDCYTKTMEMFSRAENGESGEELEMFSAQLSAACEGMMEELGDSAYKAEMEICPQADSLSQFITLEDFTACDCVNATITLFDYAGKGEEVPEEIEIDLNKCIVLQSKIGIGEYNKLAKECQEK